jgi:outer membrane receptor for ferrienterochelin and colicins
MVELMPAPLPLILKRLNKFLLVICLASWGHISFSQTVILQIRDKVTGIPVEYACVLARQVNGYARDKQLTDKQGEVKLNLVFPVIIDISSLGYRDFTDTLLEGGNHTIMLSPDFYQLDQVVVTGQFRPQPVDRSIYHIEVIDARQIQLKAANNLGELLKTEPGFQLRSEGVLGDFVRIRGLSGEHVKILIDGMPVTGRVADRIDLGQLALQNVDHIEIIEGPMSVVYGSNALAGAINIITKDYSGKQLHVSANTYYETIGAYNFNLSLAKQFKRHTFNVNAARNFFSGWGPVAISRYKTWKPKLQYMAGATYQYRKNRLKATLNSDFLHEELRDPGALTLANLYEKALDGYHYTTRWNNRLNLLNKYNDDFVVNLQAGYSYYKKRKITYLNDLVNLRKNIAGDADLHDTTVFQMLSARGFVSNIPGKKVEYQTGFDLNYESASGKRTGGYREMSDMSGFMNFVYRPVSSLSLQPGIRLIYNSNYKAPLAYGLSFKFNPAPYTIKASYARGFRAPSLKQLYLVFIDNNHEIHGNENLKAETADIFNVTLNYDLIKNKHDLGVELGTFYNTFKNAIQLAISTQRPGWGMYFNVDNTRFKTKGAEITIHYRYSPYFTLNTGVISTGRLRLDSPDQFAWATDYTSSAVFRYEKLKLQLALFYKYSGDYLEFAGNYNAEGDLDGIAQQSMDGYNTLDATITKGFLEGRLNMSTGVKNIFNVKLVNSFGNINIHGSSDDSAAMGYGRTFFLSVGYAFDKL